MTFLLVGKVVPKARPRVTQNGTFHNHNYADWKNNAIAQLFDQSTRLDLPLPQGLSIDIKLSGLHRGDIDNIAGAILDALVQSGILKDDSLKWVPNLSIRHVRAGGKQAEITITKQ